MAAKGLWAMLNVDNVSKSVEWYKALGFDASVDPMDVPGMPPAEMGVVDLGDSGLLFWNKNIIPEGQAPDTKAWVSGELGKGVMLNVGVRDAKKTWAKAQKLGASVEEPLAAQPWGGHGFSIVDPDGYLVAVSDKWPDEPKPKRKAAKRVVAKAKKAVKKVAKKPAKGKRR